MDAVSGRIQNDEIRPRCLLQAAVLLPELAALLDHLQHISGNEVAVVDAVQPCIFPGCRHRLCHDFHAHCLTRHSAHQLCDGAGAGIEIIDHRLLAAPLHLLKAGILPHLAVQLLRTERIGLEEGEGCDAEAKSQQLLIEKAFPVQHLCAVVLDGIRQGIVSGMQYSRKMSLQLSRLRKLQQRFPPAQKDLQLPARGQQSRIADIILRKCRQRQSIQLRQLRGGHQIHQNLSGFDGPAHQKMPKVAAVAPFMKIADAKPGKILSGGRQNHPEIRMGELTVIGVQNVEEALLLMQSQGQRAVLFLITEGKFHFVPVAGGNGRGNNGLK